MNHATATHRTITADALRASYEQLRGEAIGTGGDLYRGFGFALLVREGLAAWLLACRDSAAASPRPPQASVLSQTPSPASVRTELTMILTAMALGDGRTTA